MDDPDPRAGARGPAATEPTIVLTTLPTMEAGESLVRALVEEGLIACGNLVPGVRSIYRWEGNVVAEAEVLAILKTVTTSVTPVFDRISQLHPYSVPELVELRTEHVAASYRAWVLSASEGG